MVYEPYPLNCVCIGSCVAQNCDGSVEDGLPPTRASGTLAMISQLSVLLRPVLSPAWNDSPFWSRPFSVMSTPFQCSVWVP